MERSNPTSMAKGGQAQKKREWRASPGLELMYVYNSKVLVLYMISPSCLYFRSEWVNIMTYTEDTAVYRVRVVYANSNSRRNKTYGSPL